MTPPAGVSLGGVIVFTDSDFQYGFERALGGAYRGMADVGEVLATAAQIQDGDADSWVDQWTATAGEAWDAAQRGRRVSAATHYLRACGLYAAALHGVPRSSEPERHRPLWRRQRDCWDRAVDLLPVAEQITIPYEGALLPGYFFRAPGARAGEPRPLVVINNGSETPTSAAWVHGGAAAGERGYHWMTFDGPGQQAARYELGLPFRPDWEAVLAPVLDTMLARPDVDGARVAVIGVNQGGFWVPRALSFEHRFAAAVVDPGIVDVGAAWRSSLTPELREQLRAGAREQFDREMHIAALFAPADGERLRFFGEPYAASPYGVYEALERYRLGDELEQLVTPLLITAATGDQYWPGQADELFERVRGSKQLVTFDGSHGEPLAGRRRETRIFDWLDGHLAR
jgi:hypothetical protein